MSLTWRGCFCDVHNLPVRPCGLLRLGPEKIPNIGACRRGRLLVSDHATMPRAPVHWYFVS
jgi:hypothetical protein